MFCDFLWPRYGQKVGGHTFMGARYEGVGTGIFFAVCLALPPSTDLIISFIGMVLTIKLIVKFHLHRSQTHINHEVFFLYHRLPSCHGFPLLDFGSELQGPEVFQDHATSCFQIY